MVGTSIFDPMLMGSFDAVMEFLGGTGRFATLPDLTHLRLLSDPPADPWRNRAFTSASTQYLGNSPKGIPLIVIAHHLGPLGDAGIRTQWLANSNAGEASIPTEAFHKLLDGKYGEVIIIPYYDYFNKRKFPFSAPVSYEDAMKDILFRSYFGIHAEAYLTKCHAYSVKHSKERATAPHAATPEYIMKAYSNTLYYHGHKISKQPLAGFLTMDVFAFITQQPFQNYCSVISLEEGSGTGNFLGIPDPIASLTAVEYQAAGVGAC